MSNNPWDWIDARWCRWRKAASSISNILYVCAHLAEFLKLNCLFTLQNFYGTRTRFWVTHRSMRRRGQIQCNLDIRNPGYKEQLGYKELFSEFFFYVMGFLDIRNKFGIFPKWKNLDIRNDFQGKCNHFDQNFTETPLRVLFVMICNSCVCCFWWVIHHPPRWHHQKTVNPI